MRKLPDSICDSRAVLWLLGFIVVLLPLVPLLDLRRDFFLDWHNVRWMTGYFGEYFSRHGRFPATFQTNPEVGMPCPIFYGHLLFPLLGWASTILSEAFVIRAAVFGLWAAQFVVLFRLFRELQQSREASGLVSALVLWAIYPMTNLYNRAAIAELVATGCLTCVLGLGIRLLFASGRRASLELISLLALGILFMVGTHPITAVVGSFFLLTFWVPAYFGLPRRHFRWETRSVLFTLFAGLLIAIILSPWIYATLKFRNDLHIATSTSGLPLVHPFESLAYRFAPIPFDPRMAHGATTPDTPYDDVQINLPLLLLVIAEAIGLARLRGAPERRKGFLVAGFGGALFLLALALSLLPELYRWMPGFLCRIQLGYRMITYANAALLLAIAGLLSAGVRVSARKPWPLLCLALALASVVIKWNHAFYPSTLRADEEVIVLDSRDRLTEFPPTFYAVRDYLTPFLFRYQNPQTPEKWVVATVPVGKGASFGETGEVRFSLDTPTYVQTNIELFPWNRIELDGKLLLQEETFRTGIHIGFLAAPGEHELAYRFVPDPIWERLSNLAIGSLIAVLLALVAYFGPLRSRRMRTVSPKMS